MQKRYQQGDVNLFLEGAVPGGLKKLNPGKRGYVLAKGESTGHAHVVDDLPSVAMFEDDARNLWITSDAPFTVRHEEHKEISLPAGNYRVGIVREVDPFSEEILKISD